MGLIVLDANIVIAVLNAHDRHHPIVTRALSGAIASGDAPVVPASAYAESLVEPAQAGAQAMQRVDEFLASLPADVEAVTREIARAAARLRARHRNALRLGDALVVATAQVLGARTILTTDARWPEVDVDVTVLRP